MSTRHFTRRPETTPVQTEAPSSCPSCGSRDVTTTSKAVTAESYWRCVTCGEVWNHGRRATTNSGRSQWFSSR